MAVGPIRPAARVGNCRTSIDAAQNGQRGRAGGLLTLLVAGRRHRPNKPRREVPKAHHHQLRKRGALRPSFTQNSEVNDTSSLSSRRDEVDGVRLARWRAGRARVCTLSLCARV